MQVFSLFLSSLLRNVPHFLNRKSLHIGEPSASSWRAGWRRRGHTRLLVPDLRRPALRHLFAPNVFAEPFIVMFHDGALLLGLIDRVAETFIQNQLDGNTAIFQRLV